MELIKKHTYNNNIIEIGVDEAGRGPLLGRVYTAAVIWNSDLNPPHGIQIKDSKKLSHKNIVKSAQFIMEYATAYSIDYSTEEDIDKYNILQATMNSMHKSINNVINIMDAKIKNNKTKKKIQLKKKTIENESFTYLDTDNTNNTNNTNNNEDHEYLLLIDGSYFRKYENINHKTCVKGDSTYFSIACASILAKYSRDLYIENLCKENPDLDEKYKTLSNKGYGSAYHIEGIKKYGVSKYHRLSFGPCIFNHTLE